MLSEIDLNEGSVDIQLEALEDDILKQVELMASTINDFRDFFLPSDKNETFKSCELVNEVYPLIESKMKRLSIDLEIHRHNCFEVAGLKNEFKQVILNIYHNACDALEKCDINNRKIDVFFETTTDHGIIRVRDTAGGIPEELLPDKLFDAYVTTKGKSGTGIGLQMSRLIIEEKFKGKLWAHNSEKGAEFVIEIPLVKHLK